MKLKTSSILPLPKLALAAVISLSASAMAATNNWNTGDGTWDTSTANWASPTTWTNGDDAVFNNTAAATSITLSSGLTAGTVTVGSTGNNNANYTFTGSGLTATTFSVQGTTSNDLGTSSYPTTTLNNATLNVTNLYVGRAKLVIDGNSVVTATNIGGPGGDTNGAWGQLTIAGNANVTATNGISGGSTAWGINLDGGTLTTKGIDYGPHSYSGTTNIKFNGTLIKANQDNASFITASTGLDFAPDIQAGGAKIDSNGYTIGIGIGMGGTGALTKSGSGTLNLNVANSYTGGTFVNGGTLSLNHEPIGIANTAIGAMTSSNTVTINNGGTLTGTKNNWLGNTGLASGGANAISVVVNQGGTLKGGSGFVSGLGNVNLNGGTIEVTNGLGAYGWNASFTLGGDITVGGSSASYITTASGAGATANIYMANGSNGTGGTRTFTVADVTSSAASDLIVSARLAQGTVIKAGAGTLEMAAGASGAETAVAWQVNAGKLLVNSGVTVGNATVASGATLAGSGTVGDATITGILAPGNSIGTLNAGNTTWKGAATANADTIWEFELGAGNTSDLLNITGDFTKDDSAGSVFRFDFMNSGYAGVFKLVDWSNTTTFSSSDFSYTNLGGGLTGSFTINGSQLEFTAVPEPTTALASLLLTAGLLRRRR
jgi:autotransporter-associated beta strand protein